jgi:tRNA pseudouridine55 synthase
MRDGLVVVDKPGGCTSHDVVARLRHVYRQRRVGHAGTLDPEASGVLPVCLGQGTRVTQYLMDATKSYRAESSLASPPRPTMPGAK